MDRTSPFRRFNSRKAFEVSRNCDSESQYERSILSQLDQLESIEVLVQELKYELPGVLCLFGGGSEWLGDSDWVSWCSDERPLRFRFGLVGGGWESDATIGLGEHV